MILNNYPIKPIHGKIPTSQQLQYTQVLTKQSLLFNVWKEMCRLFDTENISIRVQPTFVAQPGIPEKTVSTIGLVGDLDSNASMLLGEASANIDVKPKTVRVRKTAVKKTVAAKTASVGLSSLMCAEATQVVPAHEPISYAGATQVAPTLLIHQDTKTKKRSKSSVVQGAVLAL